MLPGNAVASRTQSTLTCPLWPASSQSVDRKTANKGDRSLASNGKVATLPFGHSRELRGRAFVTALPATGRKTDASQHSSKNSRLKASNSGTTKPEKPVRNRLVMVLVEVQKEFIPGSNLELLGGTPELGFWKRNPKKPSSLHWDENDSVWKGEFFLPAGLCCEFKCMEITPSGYVYEKGNNREIRIPADAGAMVLSFAWGDTATTNAFVLCEYSAADEDMNGSQSAEAAAEDESPGQEVPSTERSGQAVFSESSALWPASAFTMKQRRREPFPRRFDANAYAPEAAADEGSVSLRGIAEATVADAPTASFPSSAELWPGSASARRQSSFPRAFAADLVESAVSERVDGSSASEGSVDRGDHQAEAREYPGGASGFAEGVEQPWAASARSQKLRASNAFPRAFAPQKDKVEQPQFVERQQEDEEDETEEAVAAAVHFKSPEQLWPGTAWTKQQRELSPFPRAFSPAATTEAEPSVAFDAPDTCWSASAAANQQRALHPFPRELSSVPEPEPSVAQPAQQQQQQQQQIPKQESEQPQPQLQPQEPQVQHQEKQEQQMLKQKSSQQPHLQLQPEEPQVKQQQQQQQQQVINQQQQRPNQAQARCGSGTKKQYRSAKSFPRSFASAAGLSTNSEHETIEEPSSNSRGPWRVSYTVSTLRDGGSSCSSDATAEEDNDPKEEPNSPWRTSAWANRQRSLRIASQPSED